MVSSKSVVRGPHPASLCTVFIEKMVRLQDGTERSAGFGTGFLYRRKDVVWLVTCWHVLTGRRPDDPGLLVNPSNGESPWSIRVVHALKQTGAFSTPLPLDLYQDGKPIWIEKGRQTGVDLAAIALNLPDHVSDVCVQDFGSLGSDSEVIEIGLDVVTVGYPLGHGPQSPFPIWKKAMIASEPRYLMNNNPYFMLDTAGVPGMSGSPIFRIGRGHALKSAPVGATALDRLMSIDFDEAQADVTTLSFVGIYAGATGTKNAKELDHLNLGRAYMAGFLNSLIDSPEAGTNPFAPQL